MVSFIKKHSVLSLGILLPVIFILLLIFLLLSTGQLATLDKNAAIIGRDAGILSTFIFVRNILFVVYILNLLIQILRIRVTSSGVNAISIKSVVLYTISGIILTSFSYLIAALAYDVISILIMLVTNPNFILKYKR